MAMQGKAVWWIGFSSRQSSLNRVNSHTTDERWDWIENKEYVNYHWHFSLVLD
jgi:hypothetical protein